MDIGKPIRRHTNVPEPIETPDYVPEDWPEPDRETTPERVPVEEPAPA